MDAEPTNDTTPPHVPVSDHAWFPCPHCGRAIKCPPVAMPVEKDTTALLLRRGHRDIPAPELAPELGQAATTIMPLPDLIVELDLPGN